jgi:cation transport regulator
MAPYRCLVIYHVEQISGMPRKSTSGNSSSSSRGRKSVKRKSSSSSRRSRSGSSSSGLSPRTKKNIDTLPADAKEVYRKAHKSALKQYKSPAKRRGGKSQSREQVAHKVAWSAVKKAGYKKEGDRWEKED